MDKAGTMPIYVYDNCADDSYEHVPFRSANPAISIPEDLDDIEPVSDNPGPSSSTKRPRKKRDPDMVYY